MVQRVSQAAVQVGGAPVATIGRGLLVLLGVAASDTERDAAWLAAKVVGLRVFREQMDVSLVDDGPVTLLLDSAKAF